MSGRGTESSFRYLLFHFNLAIERLFMSGNSRTASGTSDASFQSRNREAFHFRMHEPQTQAFLAVVGRFNLAIEMLFISGATARLRIPNYPLCFNLVIEMLFISGLENDIGRQATISGFNLAIEMLFISGIGMTATRATPCHVSISQSRCFSFQDGWW